ncbi:MAG TPA: hypothetical protein VK809_00755 [Bacteroidia bacterium]|jgi:hypothetical protein|nr:hypothetical protein [Bacteroidia bacterium]
MKRLIYIILMCSFGEFASAQTTLNKLPPTQDNSSIRKSEKAQSKQTKGFQARRSYASMKGHGTKKTKAQKNRDQGKGL